MDSSKADPTSRTQDAIAGDDEGAGVRLERAARQLAEQHTNVSKAGRKGYPLLQNVASYSQMMRRAYQHFQEAGEDVLAVSHAAEWLLDNYYLVERTFRQIRDDMPVGYYRLLPVLGTQEPTGRPRVYAMARALAYQTDGVLDLEVIRAFTEAYQSVTPLSTGELWAIPVMLRIVSLENATAAVARLVGMDAWDGSEPPTSVLTGKVDDDAAVAHSIHSLRELGTLNWTKFLESVSLVERLLRRDPAGVYPRMDTKTRDRYRQAIEAMARRIGDDEQKVAQAAVRLAESSNAQAHARPPASSAGDEQGPLRRAHVGYYLIDAGRAELEEQLGYRPSASVRLGRWLLAHPTAVYLGGVGLLALGFTVVGGLVAASAGAAVGILALVILLSLVPATTLAVDIVNWVVTHTLPPRMLPKLDPEHGIPTRYYAFVSIPSMLTSSQEVDSLLQQLERHYLGNNDPRLRFALLTDYADASQKEMPEDDALLQRAIDGVRALNEKYGYSGFRPFYLFHRERQWNPHEARWMGWERKRGKLEEFNKLLRGDDGTSYMVKEGDLAGLPRIRYVITLDADTILPRDSAVSLVATLAHPLNRAAFDPRTGRVVAGYTVLQPRIEIDPTSSGRSAFARLFSGGRGLDLYTLAVSDAYQDLFGEGIYAGKGIYDVGAFARSLDGRVPQDALLSHDLFEGIHGRAGLVTDIHLIEEYPSHYLAYARRLHRWVRGDWQLLPWLGARVPGRDGHALPSPLSVIGRWKVADNLRRSLVMPALLALWAVGWLGLAGSPLFWTLAGLSVLVLPVVGEALDQILRGIRDRSLSGAGASVAISLQRQLLKVAFIPFQAAVSLDAILRTLIRLTISRKRMLEWTSAAHTSRALAQSTSGAIWREMAAAPIIAVALAALVLIADGTSTLLALPLLALWLLSPQIAAWISRPRVYTPEPVTEQERAKLRRLARRTWLFFEESVGPDDHWLPPDHLQQNPRGVAARRTSPTNIGLLLLSILSAYDLGYLGPTEMSLRLRYALDGIDDLEKHRGHLLNWYDTRTLEPLAPRYVSTVDSGNLAAALVAVRQACLEMPNLPAFRWQRWQGLLDTMDVLSEVLGRLRGARAEELAAVQAALSDLEQRVLGARDDPPSWVPLLVALYERELPVLEQAMARLLEARQAHKLDAETLRDVRTWVERVRNHLTYMRYALSLVLPWSFMLLRPPEWVSRPGAPEHIVRAWEALAGALPATLIHKDMPAIAGAARERLSELQALLNKETGSDEAVRSMRAWCALLREQLDQAERDTARRMEDFRRLAERLEAQYVAVDFSFLYDDQHQVFHIGYNVDAGQLDEHHYDLLASEARVASLLAISKDEVEQRHWLHLSRPLAQLGGQRVLLSWSGTMFEYLMPDLYVRRYEGSLLAESSRGAVARQIAYGRERRVPWGISESGYYRFDSQMNYQYRAFGAPGLGIDRGLEDHLVVTPYASLLALSIAPRAVLRNIEELEAYKMLGRYGFFEALDFSPGLPAGQRHAIVQSFMVHHQGMILLSLTNYLQGDSIVRRFHSDLRVQSVEPLLQEQVPLRVPLEAAAPDQARAIRPRRAAEEALTAWPAAIDGAVPQSHLLSNGRYSTVITSAGTGYSRWRGLQLTRWRADTTLDSWGSWIYLRDRDTGALWSATRQPIGPAQGGEEARFSPQIAEFVRRERGVSTRLEVAVSLDEDVEIRRLTVINGGDSPRRLSLCSYSEVVLEPAEAEQRHPAFSKLFVQSEYLGDLNALLYWRRPRSAEEEPAYLLHLVLVQGEKHRIIGAHETDRGRFLGRTRDARSPLALTEGGGGLSGTTGTTLDPIMALAQHLDLDPRGTARVAFVTLAAESRERALELAHKYRSWGAIDRVYDGDGPRLGAELRQLGIDPDAMEAVQQLFSAVLYPYPALRAHREALMANTQGQPRLWPYAISGDFPVLMVRIKDSEDMRVVQQALLAHSYWRRCQQSIDLVILNERDSGYAQDLHNQLLRLISRTGGDAWLNARGGIFVLRRDQMAPEDRTLLEATARVILDASAGSLTDQLAPLHGVPLRLPALAPTRPMDDGPERTPPLERPLDLAFDNGMGGFTPDGREYVVYLEPGRTTPAPWINVVANETFGFLVSESGGGYTWAVNSGENRITPWNNDPVSDPAGEALYLRDEETGEVWTPTPLPAPASSPYKVRHGAGYTVFEHHSHELVQALKLYVAPDAPVKIAELSLRNTSERPRRVTATYYAEWVLYTLRDAAQMYVVPEYDAEARALLARNPYNTEFGERVAFLAGSGPPHGVTADRSEFLGRMGTRSRPAALTRVGLEGRVQAGTDPCAALQLHVDLAPGETRIVHFVLGQGDDRQHARDLVLRFQDPQQVATAWEGTQERWDRLLSAVQVRTPDPAMDILLNRWLLYQALSSRIWGRSALYQSSGAYGFRDQLQDVMSLSHVAPDMMREQIVRAAAHQFEEGDVLHWWHPPSGRGVRTRFSDDLLWLPYVTAHYIHTTHDASILEERVPFLRGEPLAPGENERYDHYVPGEEEHSIYEHCVRAIERGATKGPHGIPLMGGGDWNDGMDRVGIGGKGESVWLGWFLYSVLDRFAPICAGRGDAQRAEAYRRRAQDLRGALEAHAWDGDWYRRAFYDDGTPLGSAQSEECKIDAIAQSWAVLSGAGRPERTVEAMGAVSRTLVRRDERLVLLFSPPFDKTPRDPGYIKGYPPGIRENGGQYTHGASWTAWAFAALGWGDDAGMLFRMMNPIYHSDTRAKAELYRVEPYVIAADIYSVAPHTGRGGWTWYTGSAGWFYRLGVEAILGLSREGDQLRVDPCIPKSWPHYQVTYRNRGATYHIRVENPDGVSRGVRQMTLNGIVIPGELISLREDGVHEVTVTLGEAA